MADRDAAWAALEAAALADGARRIDGFFDTEPDRLARLTLQAAGLTLDLSKQPWSAAGWPLVLGARPRKVPQPVWLAGVSVTLLMVGVWLADIGFSTCVHCTEPAAGEVGHRM